MALQDVADFNPTDISKVKMIERKYVLPLPRTSIEGNEWMYRYRKGFRVYAMYPSTTVLYPATVHVRVVDSIIQASPPVKGMPI